MTSRIKVKCINKDANNVVNMTAVMDGSKENEEFFELTPYAELEIGTAKSLDQFEVGNEYYIDITTCDITTKDSETVKTDEQVLEEIESELVELQVKKNKLEQFIESERFKELHLGIRTSLRYQLQAMQSYVFALQKRINLLIDYIKEK